MTDAIKRSQQLVMTPQLQMAIRLLSTPTANLAATLDDWCAEHPGTLVALAADAVDPIDLSEVEDPPWTGLDQSPDPRFPGDVDVWIFGNPPQARANGRAFPRLVPVAEDPGAQWVARALRQRAKTYERVVSAVLAVRPQIATSLAPDTLEPVSIHELAEAVVMHESTVTRVAGAVRFRNLHGVITFAPGRTKLAFRPI